MGTLLAFFLEIKSLLYAIKTKPLMKTYFILSKQEQQQLLCNPHEHLQGNLPNEHLNQQSLLNQNALNAFQGPSDFTMVN